jgi:hypothetical protein
MKKLPLLIIIAFFLTRFESNAQGIPVEVLVGNEAINTQIILNKKFSKNSKAGFFGIVNFNMPHDKNDPIFRYHIILANVYYGLTKNIRVFGGGFSNKIDYGASAGIQAVFPSKNSFLMIHNRHSLVKNYASEFMIIYEYRPKISDKLNLYTRAQLMGETDFKEFKRGFQMLRLGIGNEKIQYGLGVTFDQFGNLPIKYENYGLFIRTELK